MVLILQLINLLNGTIRIDLELIDENNSDNKDLKILLENNGLIYKQMNVKFLNNKYNDNILKRELWKALICFTLKTNRTR